MATRSATAWRVEIDDRAATDAGPPMPSRWLRPDDEAEADWASVSRLRRAQLRRRHWRFLGRQGLPGPEE